MLAAMKYFPSYGAFCILSLNTGLPLNGEAVLAKDYELPITRAGVTKPSYFSFSYNPIRRKNGPVPDGFVAVVVETTAQVNQEKERAPGFSTRFSHFINDFAYTI